MIVIKTLFENLFIVSILSYSLFWFVNYSLLMNKFRHFANKYAISRNLYQCSYCFGYHVGWICLLCFDFGLKSFVFAFIVAILTYFICLIEKNLLKYSI
jgi:hypothetical protein